MVWRAASLTALLCAATAISFAQQPQDAREDAAPGQLTIQRKDGSVGALCPLKSTTVNADVAGFGASVNVTQQFHNPSNEAIEAVYTFPLPDNAAVDHMTMRIGDRVIEGSIHTRNEAKQIYDTAKAQGQTAALLDQERPNIFTQSVANITSGADISITIHYVQTLKFQDGTFEFNFPMVVGPRFLGNAPDAAKIDPPVAAKGTRSGTNIQLSMRIDAGAPIQSIKSVLHDINTEKIDESHYRVTLANADEIPNRDFILRYSVAQNAVTGTFVTHMDPDKGGFFGLALVPPKSVAPEDVTPREFIFVMDQSGSQTGFPLAKSKELTLKLIDTLRPGDTLNVIGFANSTSTLWPAPKPFNSENAYAAKMFVANLTAGGGTQLREGLIAGLQGRPDPKRLRIIVFNTDGFVGDEPLILDTLQKTRGNARVFTFGIGNGVNRFLIDNMSAEGQGAAEYVTLQENADAAVQRFVQRLRTPVLTDVTVKVDGTQVTDLEPAYLPDVFDQSPVYVFGRYLKPGKATIVISGKQAGKPWSKTMDVDLPMMSHHQEVMSLWARDHVDTLRRQSYASQFNGQGKDLKQAITETALQFGIMSEYTSFVAVENRIVNKGGKQHLVPVPVDLTQGVNYDTTVNNPGGLPMQQTLGVTASYGWSSGGGGMMGGGAVAMPSAGAAVASNGVMKRIAIRSADPAFIARMTHGSAGGGKAAGGHDATKGTSNDNKDPLSKADENLRYFDSVPIDVEIWLSDLDDSTLKALEKLGVKIGTKDKTLKLVFARIDGSKLAAICALPKVLRISSQS